MPVDDSPITPAVENRKSETYQQYIKFKMKQVKEAKEKGNHGKARRHAQELIQFLGFGEAETPIESELERFE